MHLELIELGIKLGYFSDYGGVCAGVTMAWLSACLTDTVQEAKYARLIKKIVEEGPELFDEIQCIQNKAFKKEPLTDEEIEYFQYLAFYDQIVLYLLPSRYFELFGKFLSQSDIESISSIANSESLEQKGGLFVVYKESGIYTQDELAAYLTEIAESVSPDVGPIAFSITSHDHEVGLIYTPMNSRWCFMDINQGGPKELSVVDVADNILDGFNIQPELIPRNKYTALSVQVITAGELTARKLLKTSLQALKLRHAITPALAKRVGVVGLLWVAAQMGDTKVVQSLLTNGAVVNQARSNGATPLYMAARNGHFEIVEALLANGARLNEAKLDGATPLYIAAQNGHLNVVQALLARGASLNRTISSGITALWVAAQNGHLDVVKALLSNGARINWAISDGATPLCVAAENGHLDVVNVLIADGAKVNWVMSDGATPLYVAAKNGHLDVVNALIAKGAKVSWVTSSGATPLYVAAQNDHFEVIRALLTAGARLNDFDLMTIKKHHLKAYKVYEDCINEITLGIQSAIDDLVDALKIDLDVYYEQSHQERSMLFFQRRNTLFYGFIRQLKIALDGYMESKDSVEMTRLIQHGCPFIGQEFQPLRERIDAELHAIEIKIKGVVAPPLLCF